MGYSNDGEFGLHLLGTWMLHRHGVIVHVAPRQQRLIAALAVKGPSLRSHLVGLLWPEYPDAKALESLRVSMHLVSRQVPGLIVNNGPMLSLCERADVDLHTVRVRLRDFRRVASEVEAAALLCDLRDARLLPGWYDDWVVSEQSRLQQDRLRAFTIIARQSLDQGHCETAGAAAEAALEIEPLYEAAVQILIEGELKHGNPAAALRNYQRYQKKLEEDMGLQPSDSLTRLVARVLDGQARTRKERLVPTNEFRVREKPVFNHT
ncbi:AfsR/SARP family transcriptional regulator [Arthrobacter sedimenti]|uniref:AfsR/SARP family transcriptional regulator n=1 Tax=Arthrobacter sedimenti TaxID=2694931 RepID=UPI000B351FCB|nr:BTAD domain-containing putative transcriptional regulator [Arthrobacter sedimenti]OUM41093.1 transcriptional regulator [Arthrobacter agilis]